MADAIIEKKVAAEEIEHNSQIHANYQRLVDSSLGNAEVSVREQAREEVRERVPETPVSPVSHAPMTADAAARIGDYKAHAAPRSEKTLFDNITYNGQELVYTAPVTSPEVTEAPAASATVTAPAPAPAPQAVTEEDAPPTRRTLETLRRRAAKAEQESRAGFFASLSSKTKIALIAVATAIVVILAVICINSSVLRSMDSEIALRETEVAQLREAYDAVQEEIRAATDPARVDDWAQNVKHMIRAED